MNDRTYVVILKSGTLILETELLIWDFRKRKGGLITWDGGSISSDFVFVFTIYNLQFYKKHIISFVSQIKKANPRELNPYLKDNGSGYPEENTEDAKAGGSHLLSSSVVGDGGASWRLKALKRAQEQAARDGRKLDSVSYFQLSSQINHYFNCY